MPLCSENRKFSMSVRIDGRDLPVYQVKHEGKRSEGWICSEQDKVYDIEYDTLGWRVSNRTTYKDMDISAHIDGIKTETRAQCRTDCSKGLLIGPRRAVDERAPYTFTKPELQEEDENQAVTETALDAIGTIELRFFRAKYAEPCPVGPRTLPQMTLPMSESQKKATLTSVTQFGDVIKVKPCETVTILRQLDHETAPYCKLVLRYASKDILMAMDIVPREAGPMSPDEEILPAVERPSQASEAPARADQRPLPEVSIEPKREDDPSDRLRSEREALASAERAAALDRLRRAREELEAAESAVAGSEAAETAAAAGPSKRKRSDEVPADDKTAVRRRLEAEMTNALKSYDGAPIDLTGND